MVYVPTGFGGIGASVGQTMQPFIPRPVGNMYGGLLSGGSSIESPAAGAPRGIGATPGWGATLMAGLQSPQIQDLLARMNQQPQLAAPGAPGLMMPRQGSLFQLPQLTAIPGLFGGVPRYA